MKKRGTTIALIAVLVLFACIAIYIFRPANNDIEGYLMYKYEVPKDQYSLVSVEKNSVADTHLYQDKAGNYFEVLDYGSSTYVNFMDNYQKIRLDKDAKEIVEKYFGSEFVYADNEYKLLGGFDQEIYSKDTFEFSKKGYPFRVWISSNDENKDAMLNKIKSNIVKISEELRSGIKIYQVKDTVTDYSNKDYIWNEKSTYDGSIKYSKEFFYSIVCYGISKDDCFVIDATTGQKDYWAGGAEK